MAMKRRAIRIPPLLGLLSLGAALSSSASGQDGQPALLETPSPQSVLPVNENGFAASSATVIEPETTVPAEQELGGGMASWYGPKFAGRRTASGESFDPTDYTAAHRTLPFGSKVRVTNERTGKSVVVRINDRGPFARSRVIDVSQAAARDLGLIGPGHGEVTLSLLAG